MGRRLSKSEIIARARSKRDEQWTRRVLGIADRILTPAEGVKWLKKDRVTRAAHVVDATRFKGEPKWY